MKEIKLLSLVILTVTSCYSGYSQQLGGPCEGCEAAMEYTTELHSVDTIPGYNNSSPQIHLSGRVLDQQGNPVQGVILYIWQTDREGVYARPSDAKGWGRRHGKHRGWVKTDAGGNYKFMTFRPAGYPDRKDPEHIHLVVKEKGKIPYYVEDFLFADDPRLTPSRRNSLEKRGGSGILNLREENGILKGKRNIILGQNIPNYE